jgi:hypothetical protein
LRRLKILARIPATSTIPRYSLRPAIAFAAILLASVGPLPAQHSYAGTGFDPAIPTPRSVLGYEVGNGFTPHHRIRRYASVPRLRLAGYLWPEVPARLAESPWLWTERAGRGRVIGFAGDPNFRDLWRGLLPVFANAVLLGASF